MEATNVSTQASGWNEVTILAHMTAIIAEHDRRYQQRFDDHESDLERAQIALERLRSETTLRLEQRFDAQEKGIDKALVAVEAMRHELELRQEQRFTGQERAVEVALAAVTKEFHEHLLQYQSETKAAQMAAERAIAAALASTEKAIDKQERATQLAIEKQELATEKRLESVNEFRAQLSDQASTFVRRTEVTQSINALAEKAEIASTTNASAIAALDRRTSDSFSAIGSRLDLIRGNNEGQQERRVESRAQLSSANMVLGLIIAVVTIIGFIIAANTLSSGSGGG